jgi:hypothetical protein
MLKLFFTFLSLFLVGHINAQEKIEFKFSVSSLDKSLFFDRLTYYVTPKSLIITHGPDVDFSSGKKNKKAKVVFQVKLDGSEISKLYTLASIVDTDSLKSRYDNLCIMDGLILDFNFALGNKKKTLSLSNYYVSQMQPYIDFVNMKVPEKYKIWFDKSDLEKDMAKCPESRLLEY